jgi:hypothetical protein
MNYIVFCFLVPCTQKKLALIGTLENDYIRKVEQRNGLAILEPTERHISQPHAESVPIEVDCTNDNASALVFPASDLAQFVAGPIASRPPAELIHEDYVACRINDIGVLKAVVSCQFSFERPDEIVRAAPRVIDVPVGKMNPHHDNTATT